MVTHYALWHNKQIIHLASNNVLSYYTTATSCRAVSEHGGDMVGISQTSYTVGKYIAFFLC